LRVDTPQAPLVGTRMSIEVFKRLVQALGINEELLLFGEISDKEKQDCARIQFMLQNLEDGDKEILLETMGTLAENLQKYK